MILYHNRIDVKKEPNDIICQL